MKINNMIVTFWFNDIVPKNYSEKLETELSSIFLPFSIIGVQNNIDPITPRITTRTPSNHGIYNVSKINAQFIVNFDENYCNNFEKCYEYVRSRSLQIFKALKYKCNIDILYMAILTNSEEEMDNPVSYISNLLLSERFSGKNLLEAGIRVSKILQNKYYYIMSVNDSKTVTFSKPFTNSNNETIISLPLISELDLTGSKSLISYGLEVNDKYCFNTIKDYRLEEVVHNELFKIAENRYLSLSDSSANESFFEVI